tara:strand:- start:23079 stop:24413 length:1335 start_codon:yes stop_codon:yes gene_type:complete
MDARGRPGKQGPDNRISRETCASVTLSPILTTPFSSLQKTPFFPSLRSGEHGEIGPRSSMEDATYVELPSVSGSTAFYGMFDGHGGWAAADFVSKRLVPNIIRKLGDALKLDDVDSIRSKIKSAYFQTDLEFRTETSEDDSASGTTALVVMIEGSTLLVANAGDCRAVLSKTPGKAKDLSVDQKPSSASETQRIQQAGGFVEDGYINGHLGVSRAFGNFHVDGLKNVDPEKPSPLTVEPEIDFIKLTSEDEFLIIACDGLWDVFSSANAVDFCRRNLRQYNDPERAAKSLCDEANRRDTADNISVIVVCFSPDAPRDITSGTERLAPKTTMGRAISSEGLSSLQKALIYDERETAENLIKSPSLARNIPGGQRRLQRVASINPSSPGRRNGGALEGGFSNFQNALEEARAEMTKGPGLLRQEHMTTLTEESSSLGNTMGEDMLK